MSENKTLASMELSDDDLDKVIGGAYVTVDMTIEEILSTNSNFLGFLAEAGLPVTSNKGLRGLSLFEAAKKIGADPYAIENRCNDYLGGC